MIKKKQLNSSGGNKFKDTLEVELMGHGVHGDEKREG